MQEVKHQKEIIGNLQVENKVLQEQLEEEKLKNRLIESQYIEQTEELKLSRSVAKALIEKDVSFQLKMGELTDEAEYLKCQLQKSERRALSIKENNEHEELDTASKEVTHEEESGIISPHEVTELANGNLSIGRFGQLFQACYAGRPVSVEKLASPPKMKLDYLRQEQLIRRYQRSCVLRCDSIVEVYGYCSHSDEDIFWLVMECMARGCLSDVLEDSLLTLTWGERNQLALDVGRGIDFLHSRDMLLRNTCCANILVSEDLRAKICNTGDVETTGTAEREYPISPEPYQPPEILSEEGNNSFYNLEAEAYG
ncbi:probable serine/threonine-protein kinase drkD [Ptychodera flava]|uniref:probable serine/threonine-protein kinase drkD n=1 Tax=Ptychodera flava TaxID=63121 RepID=UPI00396AA488